MEPDSEPDKIQEGIYKGTFSRVISFGPRDTSNVIINFSSDTWFGQSDSLNFPVLGQGTYKVENDLIVFTNQTNVAEDFDTTLILSGNYQFNFSYTRVEIYRYYPNEMWVWDWPDVDRYILTKIE